MAGNVFYPEFRSSILIASDTQCVDILNNAGNKSISIRLDTTGLVFYTELGHCSQECDEEFLVPFEELTPFLSEEGKDAMKYFRKQGGNGK